VKECVFDIKLVNWPPWRRGNAKYCSDGCRFDHWAEHLTIVDSLLRATSDNRPTILGVFLLGVWSFWCFLVFFRKE
jgi:hypothetical protein